MINLTVIGGSVGGILGYEGQVKCGSTGVT